MVAPDAAERISVIFPTSTTGAEGALQSILLVGEGKDSVHPTWSAVIILAGHFRSRGSGQGLDRYVICEDTPQEVDR